MMRDRMLNHAIRQAYGDTLNDERAPTYVLYLELPANEVDVNVHPAKHEVRFQQAREVHDFVLQSVREALQVKNLKQNAPAHNYQASNSNLQQQVAELRPRNKLPLPGIMGGDSAAQSMPPLVSAAKTTGNLAGQLTSVLTVVDQRLALLQQENSLMLLNLQALEQTYLVTQLQRQHATGLAGQPLLIPVKLTDKDSLQRLATIAPERLARLGILLSREGRSVVVKQVPSALRHTDINASLAQVTQVLTEHTELPETFWCWLANQQISTSYTKVQAEHWLTIWRDQLDADLKYCIPVKLPELPERLR